MGFITLSIIWPIINIIGYAFLFFIFSIICATENKKIINFFKIFIISLFILFISYILFICTMTYLEDYPINSDFSEYFFNVSSLGFYSVLMLNTIICYLFIFLRYFMINDSADYFEEIYTKKNLYLHILSAIYPFFPLIFFGFFSFFLSSNLLFGLEDFFYNINTYEKKINVGKDSFIFFIFLFFFIICIWMVGRFFFKEKSNKPFKLMLSCALFMGLMPNVRIVYEKLYPKEYRIMTKKRYVNSLSDYTLKQFSEKYPELKNELQNKDYDERRKILRKKFLEKENIKIERLKIKNYFLDIANYYFNFSIVCILLIVFFLLYLWFIHDKLADKVNSKLSH